MILPATIFLIYLIISVIIFTVTISYSDGLEENNQWLSEWRSLDKMPMFLIGTLFFPIHIFLIISFKYKNKL